ncbi:hypothetical protein BHQ23_06655 [Mycobacterium gordonae]|uniref:Uncharacterized protein n=1 Tax=Mycobacterium gordonae TaxID=1778 RepID=A0A1A6BLT5_MYCGO|nr:hypothetical protein A9W98_11115 [Mycobacterium gordonae]ODR22948.1 hypothetical protein BHQ23_06655 [Mycobacterium gordonae]ORV79450.1 hypothetical protein AWC08_30865 [Mycobacterium gordonae]
MLEFPLPQVLVFDRIGVVLWATLSTLIGFVRGHTLEDRPLAAFAVSFAVALAFAGCIELVRWLRRRLESRARPARRA